MHGFDAVAARARRVPDDAARDPGRTFVSEPPPSEAPPGARRGPSARKRRRAWKVVAATAVLAAGAGLALELRAPAAATYVTAPIAVGDVVRTVTASGMINPVETVQIGSYVSGRVEDVFCDYNSEVKKGQVCAKIDPRSYQASVDQAEAAVKTAQAQLGKDQAVLDYMKLSYDRNAALAKRSAVSQDAADQALNQYRQAQAQIELDHATIAQRQAELQSARVNLDFTNIISPVDGTVVSRSIDIGQTVAASFQTPTLFLIATDLTRMQLDANVTEASIGGIKVGQKATFTVEAFPDRTFTGAVTQVRQAPISVQNVISYDVVIEADNRDLVLKPGMTATVHVVTAERDGVERVPEAALRFAPGGVDGGRAQAAERVEAAPGARGAHPAQVWVLRGSDLVQVPVTVGLADESYVEITSDAFSPGDRVVIRRGTRAPAGGAAAVR